MAKQRISIVIQNVNDEARLIEFLRRLKPTSVVVLHDEARLRRILDAVPEIEVGAIRWLYYDNWGEADGRLHELGDAPINWLLGKWYASGLHGNPRAYLYVGNEPAPSDPKACADWYAAAANRLRGLGIRAVLMNAQPAVFEKSVVDAGAFDNLLRATADGFHIMGWHEYGGPILPIGANGGNKYNMLDKTKVQPASWPTFEQVRYGDISDNWLIGRIYWWDERSKFLGVAPAKKLITEAGQDRLDVYLDVYRQLEERYGANGYVCMRGVNSYYNMYTDYFKGIFPSDTFERAVLAQLKWLDSIYDNTVVGVNLFLWSPHKHDWDVQFGFDYSKLTKLHELLWEWTEELNNMSYPTPSDDRGVAVVVQAADGKTSVRFRAEPTPSGAQLSLILLPVDALMFNEVPDVEMLLNGVYYKMRQFKIGGRYGWAAVDLLTVTNKPADPDDTNVSIPASRLAALGTKVQALRAKIGEVAADVDALVTAVENLNK